ncbi:hypothetical protein [Glycomyces buryatensis]|uniref:Uncharacterized protein n=1 Tax=Glycomyces buryatensis TaxID=2570927 RepID=A0A4S8QDH9_9ACTN|nr:hypothetical protein [Glycomyces buryatensis]THV40955.1 hypothetical protein FAB82_13990 [Glycomyces buryatensis]
MNRAVRSESPVKKALRLHFLAAAAWIDSRCLRFEPVPGQARLRIAIIGHEPKVLESVTGLGSGAARLTV